MSRTWMLTALMLFHMELPICMAKRGFGEGEQDWGFIEVRPGAHMFYWLYYTTAENISHHAQRPLVLWLQGGPGVAASSNGNFGEIGPIDLDGKPRNFTWVEHVNVLFIDQPVGTGFSYVENNTNYASSDNEAASDIFVFLKAFYAKYWEFEPVPLHIFGQCYGAKLGAILALKLHKAIQEENMKCKLTSLSLGNPWIMPLLSIQAWPSLLVNMGLIDIKNYNLIQSKVNIVQEYVKEENWGSAAELYWSIQDIINDRTGNINVYNLVDEPSRTQRQEFLLMNDTVRKALSLTTGHNFVALSIGVQDAMLQYFMQPGGDFVSELLNKTDIQVNVYSGQFDLISAVQGVNHWIENMEWLDKEDYLKARRYPIIVNNRTEAYRKSDGQFSMFWIRYGGHYAPVQNPRAMKIILKHITHYDANTDISKSTP